MNFLDNNIPFYDYKIDFWDFFIHNILYIITVIVIIITNSNSNLSNKIPPFYNNENIIF